MYVRFDLSISDILASHNNESSDRNVLRLLNEHQNYYILLKDANEAHKLSELSSWLTNLKADPQSQLKRLREAILIDKMQTIRKPRHSVVTLAEFPGTIDGNYNSMMTDMVSSDEIASDGFAVGIHDSKLLVLDLVEFSGSHIVKVMPTRRYGG